jgi:hypothetical protein
MSSRDRRYWVPVLKSKSGVGCNEYGFGTVCPEGRMYTLDENIWEGNLKNILLLLLVLMNIWDESNLPASYAAQQTFMGNTLLKVFARMGL